MVLLKVKESIYDNIFKYLSNLAKVIYLFMGCTFKSSADWNNSLLLHYNY